MTEVLPNNTQTNGAKRYAYNSAGYLTQVEAHNGTNYTTQAEMNYNGLGQRISMDASDVIAYYVMDNNRPLTATTGNDTTTYLYGLSVIGEENTAWSYSLTDGTNTQRQLTDSTGEVTYSARYTPWGDTLESTGTGNFTFGYFGGLMDEATGLIYTGNGQYYDPSTGRFLTRGNSNSTNPYLPFDPTGALFVPLAFLGLIYGKKKHKNKLDYVVIVVFISLGVGLGLTACGTSGTLEATITPISTPIPNSTQSSLIEATFTPTNGAPTQHHTLVVTGTPNLIPTVLPECATAALTTLVDLASLEPSQVTGTDFLPYIKALSNKYGFFLPDGFEWAFYFYEYVEATPTPVAFGSELSYAYGNVCTSVLGCPAIDGGTFQYGLVYITNFAFDDLSQIKLASVMLHEGRHAWYEYKYSFEENSLGVPDKNHPGNGYKVMTEVDAHTVMLDWLSSQGVSQSDDFYQEVKSWKDIYVAAKTALGLNYPNVLPFCEPMRSWCN